MQEDFAPGILIPSTQQAGKEREESNYYLKTNRSIILKDKENDKKDKIFQTETFKTDLI